jgi:hypothetical protein
MAVISGGFFMAQRYQTIGKVGAAGCGLFVFVLFFGLVALLVLQFNQDRESARYPGAIPLSSHNNYSGLPFEYRWDDTYLTTDGFTEVYNWYSVKYQLGAESRANDRCILLDGTNEQRLGRRTISVILCNTQDGQMAFVTRSTVLDGRAGLMAGIRDIQAFIAPNSIPASQ